MRRWAGGEAEGRGGEEAGSGEGDGEGGGVGVGAAGWGVCVCGCVWVCVGVCGYVWVCVVLDKSSGEFSKTTYGPSSAHDSFRVGALIWAYVFVL